MIISTLLYYFVSKDPTRIIKRKVQSFLDLSSFANPFGLGVREKKSLTFQSPKSLKTQSVRMTPSLHLYNLCLGINGSRILALTFELGEYKYNHAKKKPCAVNNHKSNLSSSTSENSVLTVLLVRK